MTNHRTPSTKPAGRARRRLALVAVTLVAATVPVSAAHADYHLSKPEAERLARDYVARHYANTYRSDLVSLCRPQGMRYDSRYVYHRWKCGWYDRRDHTSGAVIIAGSRTPGLYYGRVLHGAR
ncbi:MAG TPA: hypothetical protein VGM91_12145 [Conexibacter sp.]|jgi:hypothetical protein